MPLATACDPLDALLDGGLETDAITLVFGEGGSGKTNLALQCARQAAAAGKRVAFVDTEGVSATRMQQIFAVLGEDAEGPEDRDDPAGVGEEENSEVGSEDAPDTEPEADEDVGPADIAQDRVLFFTPFSIEEQERAVRQATRAPGLGLVVVDSINMHYRLHIDGGEDMERQASRSLYAQLHHLTNFARKHRVPVLITGQVFGTEDTTQPFARRTMEHLVKALVRFEKRPDGSRRATVLKHRSIEDGRQARFRIAAHGLVPDTLPAPTDDA